MKKGVKIALGIVGVLVVGGAALAAWQWNNLNALRYGLTLDRDTIDQKLQDNEQALNDAMAEYNIQGYAFSREEIAQLADGTLSTEEAAKKLLEGQTPQAASPEGASGQQEGAPQSETDQAIQEQTARNRLATAVEVLATKQESMGQSLERLNEKMDSLERRPGQRWESLADKVLLVLAGAFVSFLLAGGAA